MTMAKELEEGLAFTLDYQKLAKVSQTGQAVVPVVVQDAATGEVLILAYANEFAVKYSLEHNVAAFWSTSRNELWVKGATSGDTLSLVEMRVNCEQNSLLYLVKPQGKGACHTKWPDGATRAGCYYRRVRANALEFVSRAK